MKTWVKLFNIIHREDLEMALNQFISEYEVVDIRIWNDGNNWWNASVRYTLSNPPEQN